MGKLKLITKSQARSSFNMGYDIVVVPCNCTPKSSFAETITKWVPRYADFDKAISKITFEKCNPSLGFYLDYYIAV